MKKSFLLIVIFLISASCLYGCGEQFPKSSISVGQNSACKTIQQALDAATFPFQQIIVDSGIYEESLVINKPISLIGRTNSVTLKGSITISSDFVEIKKIAMNGEQKIKSAIIIDNKKDIKNLKIVSCQIKGFTEYGFVSESSDKQKTKLEGVTLDECNFLSNGICAISCDNLNASTILNCYFEKNGNFQKDVSKNITEAKGSAIHLDLQDGSYSGIKIWGCDFKYNSNDKNEENAAIMARARGGEGDDITSFLKATYNGEILVNNCFFLDNKKDISSGHGKIASTKIEFSMINTRSHQCSFFDFSK